MPMKVVFNAKIKTRLCFMVHHPFTKRTLDLKKKTEIKFWTTLTLLLNLYIKTSLHRCLTLAFPLNCFTFTFPK